MPTPARPDHLVWRTAVVNGRPAQYGVAGTGPALVFLHGWGLGHRAYKRALGRITTLGVRVYAPALPGFGGTPDLAPEDFSLDGYARWVAAFMVAVGVERPAILAGHSFGGGVAIKTAHDWPGTVSRLVVVNSIGGSAWTESKGVVRSMAERPLWDWGLHLQADVWPLRQASRVLPVIAEDAVLNLLRNPRALLRVGRLAAHADLVPELEELKRRGLPVVVLWGRNDKVVTSACLESLKAALGDADVVTVPGNHSWLLTDPDTFVEVMTNVVRAAQALDGGRASA